MIIDKTSEELLEKLWMHSIHLIKNDGLKKELYNKVAVKELENSKLIELDGDKIYLTPEGYGEFKKIIKGRKLSEKSGKILHDVLGLSNEFMGTKIYNFEPVKENMVEGCACTFPSHDNFPSSCGCEGSCKCAAELKKLIENVLPLARVKKGQSGKIVYIKSTKCENLNKILSIGFLPGREVKIVQTHPSHVLQIEHTQIAVDSEIADSIFVGGLE